MAIDVSSFQLLNVIDTCSIWNVLSSKRFYSAIITKGCNFSCTQFVIYECLFKPRKVETVEDKELKSKLVKERERGHFSSYHISIEDLQSVEILENRKALSKGELSSIVFAKKTRQAFLTDDQNARKLASNILDGKMIQTTPQLLGCLIYESILSDNDLDIIISDHNRLKRPLERYFRKVYNLALELKLAYKNRVNFA